MPGSSAYSEDKHFSWLLSTTHQQQENTVCGMRPICVDKGMEFISPSAHIGLMLQCNPTAAACRVLDFRLGSGLHPALQHLPAALSMALIASCSCAGLHVVLPTAGPLWLLAVQCCAQRRGSPSHTGTGLWLSHPFPGNG